MDSADARKLAIAIAKANRHPDPEGYATRVETYFSGGVPQEDLPAEPEPESAPAQGEGG